MFVHCQLLLSNCSWTPANAEPISQGHYHEAENLMMEICIFCCSTVTCVKTWLLQSIHSYIPYNVCTHTQNVFKLPVSLGQHGPENKSVFSGSLSSLSSILSSLAPGLQHCPPFLPPPFLSSLLLFPLLLPSSLLPSLSLPSSLLSPSSFSQVLDLSGNQVSSLRGLGGHSYLTDINMEENEVWEYVYVMSSRAY